MIQVNPETWTSNLYEIAMSSRFTNGTTLHSTNFQDIEQPTVVKKVLVGQNFLLQNVTENGSFFLNVKVEIKIHGEKMLRQINTSRMADHYVLNQFRNVFNDPTFSDFTFVVQNKEFKVHKAILAASSEVMRKIFTTNLMESNKGQCKVVDIEPEIFENLLRFVYTGQLPENLDDVSLALFKAAHYYGISDLVEICKQCAHYKLNAENAEEMYELANIYDLNDVKLDAWNIIQHTYRRC